MRSVDAAEQLALANFCAELTELRTEREHLSEKRQQLFDRITQAAANRQPILALLEELLDTTRAETVRSFATNLPGVGPGQPDEEHYVCPDGACGRAISPEPGGVVPHCDLLRRSIKRA